MQSKRNCIRRDVGDEKVVFNDWQEDFRHECVPNFVILSYVTHLHKRFQSFLVINNDYYRRILSVSTTSLCLHLTAVAVG